MQKIIKLLATSVRSAAHSAAENGIGVELRERFAEFMRRVRRGGLVFVGFVGSLLAYSLILHPIGLLLWIIALPLAAVTAALSMLWPTRGARLRRRDGSPGRNLSALARRTRLELERRTRRLPRQAHNAARAAIDHLNEIANGTISPNDDPLLRGEAERLIGGHLPRLVDSYCMLSDHERGEDSEADRHFTEGLTAIAAELGDICRRLSEAASRCFEIERRFVSMRFPTSGLAEAR